MDEPIPTQTRRTPPPQATGLKRVLFVILGLFFVGMAYLGAILPGLPTTPFVLLASYFFARSSERLQRWIKRTPYFGHMIRDWEAHRGIRRSVKIVATCIIIPVVSSSIAFTQLPLWVKIVIGCMAGVGLCTIWFIVPTVRWNKVQAPTEASHAAAELVSSQAPEASPPSLPQK